MHSAATNTARGAESAASHGAAAHVPRDPAASAKRNPANADDATNTDRYAASAPAPNAEEPADETEDAKAAPSPPVQDDETARFPNPALRRWVAARDRTCRAPGCTAPARSCDIDHTVDHTEDGPTRHDNLGLLCRHHHGMKHEGGFDLAQPEPGRFIWISPSGKTYSTDPDPPR